MRGIVKWYNAEKGYGFITPEDGEKDVFVHISQFEKIGIEVPQEGMPIEFNTYRDRGRIAAGEIRLLKEVKK